MPWQQIKINVKAADAEAIGDLLSELEAQAVSFIDAKDTPVYEPKPGEVLLWPDTQVIGLYDADFDLSEVIATLSSLPLFKTTFNYALDQLEDKEWEREWMVNFHPMQFGKRLWICPSWRDAPDPLAINVKLDPGLAFGTGTHPTTSLCLRWLDSQQLENKDIVDFGCGSGILAVAALKLGAKNVIGIDIDPQALLASKQNAQNNEVDSKLKLYLPEHQPKASVDLVLANILAAPLKALHRVITDYCKTGGNLVMSGILVSQVSEVVSKYQADFDFEEVVCEGEWVRLVGRRISS
ncbi:50S ribosomal protein L11 methyltransferase [Glaciecola sp. SC05]|uniref:50S ribosomal protein L11 methyltransferase n=1 Tax=Glaciecola sp. SC05 TaxID=1987355 RepID=UPI0035288932